MPLLSIIIPAFNTADLLARAILSIIDSCKLYDIELLIIDDCSTDSTRKISHNLITLYADFKINYIRNIKNIGLGPSRNVGLLNATGKYIAFLDSDDSYISVELSGLCKLLLDNDFDLVLFNHQRIYSTGKKIQNKKTSIFHSHKDRYLSEKEKIEFIYNFPVAWNKIYLKSSLVDFNMQFLAGYYEDIPWTYSLLYCSKRVYCYDKIIYNYHIRDGSILNSKSKKHFAVFKQYRALYSQLYSLESSQEYINHIYNRMLKHIYSIYSEKGNRIPKKMRIDYIEELSRIALEISWRYKIKIDLPKSSHELEYLDIENIIRYGKYYTHFYENTPHTSFSKIKANIRCYLIKNLGYRGLVIFYRASKLLFNFFNKF